jgi:aminoglycoside phosphotransferase (APT) family kinase protein
LSKAFDFGPAPQRITIEPEQVRRLVKRQFPQWADLSIRPVANDGWDNRTFHLGADMTVRLPSAAEYALAVGKEHRWLPALAPHLPLTIPVPLALGEPDADYPHPWSIYQWLDGEPADAGQIADPLQLAADLAEFLKALRNIDPADGPRPGIHNWFRGGPLRTFEGFTHRALAALDGHIDVGLARKIWKDALDAPWDGTESWLHGDLAAGNILLNDGLLAAVIDFGTCGVGDPSCDLAIAWTLLAAEARQTFRTHLSIDDTSWARGRGWALWKTLDTYASTLKTNDRTESATARRILSEILSDHPANT